MSLISNADYLTHSLRLTYLRHAEDPYGPRLISLSPRYLSNPYILAAGLADTETWPEITSPATPPLETRDIDAEGGPSTPFQSRSQIVNSHPSGFPGATGLKYTQTILGPSRSGIAGMRVSGRRASVAKDSPTMRVPSDAQNRSRSDSAPTPVTGSPGVTVQITSGTPQSVGDEPGARLRKLRSAGKSSGSTISVPSVPPIQGENHSPHPNEPIPKFSRVQEMEEKRIQRMRARYPGLAKADSSVPVHPAVEETDSGSEYEGEEDEDEEDLEALGVADDSQDDEFDPEFAQAAPASAMSDELSLLSIPSVPSTSQSSTFGSSLQIVAQSIVPKSRLSPVNETGREWQKKTGTDQPVDTQIRLLVKPEEALHDLTLSSKQITTEKLQPNNQQLLQSDSHRSAKPHHRGVDLGLSAVPMKATFQSVESGLADFSFAREKVPPRASRPAISTLSSMLASQSSGSENPFTELYLNISGRAETSSVSLKVYFPHSKDPAKPVTIKVRKDATVEEVIGFGLWTYWDLKLEPKLDDRFPEEDPKRAARLSAAAWNLRLVEDDGEVDEDFPAPDRLAKIAKFGFEEFAICEATGPQILANQALEAKITRKPSGILKPKTRPEPGATLLAPTGAGTAGSVFSNADNVPGLNPGNSISIGSTQGPPVFLRIRVAETADVVLRSTTINATTDMYMADVLDTVCRKRRIDPKEWALVSGDMKILIPLDRTVASLQGTTELVLVKRALLPELGLLAGLSRTTNPNDSIFKRLSEVPQTKHNSVMDFTDAYKSFVVHRKLPMLVGRLERTLAIDGDHIHIMPSTKAFLDNMKTSSYHVGSVISVRQSGKARSNVKLVVLRDGGSKTYEFEAENEDAAAAIVQRIKNLQKADKLERSGTVSKSKRRSRNVA